MSQMLGLSSNFRLADEPELADLRQADGAISEGEIDALCEAVQQIVDGRIDVALPRIEKGSKLGKLIKQIDTLRGRLAKTLAMLEEQTLAEGATESQRREDMRRLAGSFDAMVARALENVDSYVHRALEASSIAMERANHVAAATTSTATRIAEIDRMMRQSEDLVENVSARAGDAHAMTTALSQAAESILSVAQLIRDIAFQTDLLSLNARIEAARAGAAGRGFAVVASEVKTLARQTSDATVGVKRQVEAVQASAGSVVDAIAAIGRAIEDLSSNAASVVDAVGKQSAANQEIAAHSEDSSARMTAIDQLMSMIREGVGSVRQGADEFLVNICAEPGVTAEDITFGQSAPFSGDAAGLGLATREGIELAFAECNAEGGVRGRKLRLKSVDDGYNPETTLGNVRAMVRSGGVFGFVGSVGTATSKLAELVARGGGIPFIGPVTGAAFLRDPAFNHVLNVRVSYQQEIDALVDLTMGTLKLKRPALFFQGDAYGQTVLGALQKAVERRGQRLQLCAGYDRLIGDVAPAFETLRKGDPDIIFMAGTAKPTADFVSLVRESGLATRLATISFVGSADFAKAVGPKGAGVIVSQVVPLPADPSIPVAARFVDAASRFGKGCASDIQCLEGYIIGRMVIEIIAIAEEPLTRASFLEAALGQAQAFDIDGFKLAFAPRHNQGSDRVYLTELQKDGSYRPFEPGQLLH